MKVLFAPLLALATAALVLKLVTAPLNARYDADDCRRAYARSRSMADTARVDLHPYAASSRNERRTCGEVRAHIAVTLDDVSALHR